MKKADSEIDYSKLPTVEEARARIRALTRKRKAMPQPPPKKKKKKFKGGRGKRRRIREEDLLIGPNYAAADRYFSGRAQAGPARSLFTVSGGLPSLGKRR